MKCLEGTRMLLFHPGKPFVYMTLFTKLSNAFKQSLDLIKAATPVYTRCAVRPLKRYIRQKVKSCSISVALRNNANVVCLSLGMMPIGKITHRFQIGTQNDRYKR